MRKPLLVLAAVAPWLAFAGTGHADVVYSNPVANDAFDCSFNTTCAVVASRGNDFAAQMFTLGELSVITSASFTDVDRSGATPASANWMFLAADGAGGLPGTVLSSGSSPILGQLDLGPDGSNFGTLHQYDFDVSSLTLGAGSYYFAVQAVTTNFNNYLFEGTAADGAAETQDGGVTWTASYEGLPSVAVELDGHVPEPASLVLLSTGVVGLTAIRRRRVTA